MKNLIDKILNFHCPRWDELPGDGLFNKKVVEYINQVLSPIMYNEQAITSTMIQNYSKWNVIPKLTGRKYGREQISILIVVSIYKRIINISDVKQGIELQLNYMNIGKGYNVFAKSIENALVRTFNDFYESFGSHHKRFYLNKYEVKKGAEGVEMVANAFALKLLAITIIKYDGYKNMGEKL